MSDDTEPTHLKEMRKFIAISGHSDPKDIINEYAKEELSPVLKQTQLVVESLEGIGLDKLALLFSDRSHAEIILENCTTFRKKLADEDFQTTELIAEAFTRIFEKVEKSKFELIGLSEGQISVLTGNVKILSENYSPLIKKEDTLAFNECLNKMHDLINDWELHRELSESNSTDFNEGVETGLLRAADSLRALFNEYTNNVQMEQEHTESDKYTLTEGKGDN